MEARELSEVRAAFPFVDDLGDAARDALGRETHVAELGAGQALMRRADPCAAIPFVLAGEVRVHAQSESGRDLTLYRIFPGQTCILTASCLLASRPFPAFADTVDDTRALLVPRATFDRLFATEPGWRSFVFETISDRLGDMFALIDDVVFTDLPSRLASALLTQMHDGAVALTHERLAAEVGSSREVVSRMLKDWERRGVVALGRGTIAITSRRQLALLAAR